MATERRHMQAKLNQPGRNQQTSTEGRSNRAPIPTVLLVVLPFLALAVGACGGGEGGDEETDSGDTGPPTADEIRSGSSSADVPAEGSNDGTAPAPATGSPTSASSDPGGPPYAVQLGAFERASNARQLRESLEDAGFPVWTGETGASGITLLRVRVGATTTVADARRLVDAMRARLPGAPERVWIAPLGTESEAPEEMMTATRAILDDG